MRLPALLLAATALLAGDDALLEFERAFKRSRDPEAVQQNRADALAAFTTPVGSRAGEALVKAYSRCEEEVFSAEERHRKYILRGPRDKTREPRPGIDGLRTLQDGLRDRVEGLTDAAAAAAALDETLRAKSAPLRIRLAAATRAGVAGEAALDAVVEAVRRAKKPGDALVALVAVAAAGPAARPAGAAIVRHLEAESAIVREAAASASAAVGVPGAVAPLVELIGSERGRAKVRIASALQVLTGRKLGTSASAWRAWLEAEGGPFVRGEVELGKGDPKVVGGVPTDGLYHGIPLDGEAILFVVDTSKSMNAKLLGKDAEEGGSRMDRARAELIHAIGQLQPHQRFDVIGFGGALVSFAEELLPATQENIAAGQAWVRDEALTLGTRMYDALDLAFLRAGQPVEDAFWESSVDTIFLLTDGYPIVNSKRDSNNRIQGAVRAWNLRRRVVVHTIALGKGVPAKFLRRLAEQNGGRFVHEKEGDL